MDTRSDEVKNVPALPPRLFERLAQLRDYTWDRSINPLHSSYDNWHVYGIYYPRERKSTFPVTNSANVSPKIPLAPRDPVPKPLTSVSDDDSDFSTSNTNEGEVQKHVIARISTHVLRLEREFHLCKSLVQTSDPNCAHTVRPLELIKLPSQQGDSGPLIVSIFESPGRNYLRELVDFGPAFLDHQQLASQSARLEKAEGQISLSLFLDFAIGASECLEILHHGLRVVHGELRGDAFHFDRENGVVRIINFGSGLRSFENGLTSAGWLALSKELGVKNKLQFIAPEQTGRMPAEPDSRTDIYSLGVLFWTMLTQEPAFDGETPIDIIQGVLSRRIPSVASKRLDIPDAVSEIIQKMTRKQIDERYHSTSGLKYDFVELQRILMNGEGQSLQGFKIGTRDVSSFFVLPTALFGRTKQRDEIVSIIESVARRQVISSGHSTKAGGLYSFGSSSSTSDGRPVSFDEGSSDTSSQLADEPKTSNYNNYNNTSNFTPLLGAARHTESQDTIASVETLQSMPETAGSKESSREFLVRTRSDDIDGTMLHSLVTRQTSNVESKSASNVNSTGEVLQNFAVSDQQNDPLTLTRRHGTQKFRRKGRCEVINILGAVGVGKSSLVQSVQGDIRRLGYFASGKFDNARQAPFEPVLRVMSSLIRQIFSESDVNTQYHNVVRRSLRGIWSSLYRMLDLPSNLIYEGGDPQSVKSNSWMSQAGPKKWNKADTSDSISTHSNLLAASPSTFYRGQNSTQSLKVMNTFLEVLRILASGKLICLCLDDIQFADQESIDLISNIITGRIKIVLMITCRIDEDLPGKIKAALDGGQVNYIKLQLHPLSEEEVVNFIASTLYRPSDYVFPLAAVCIEKTSGNPFYLRQMLEVCHRKHCIWYSWKENTWQYDLDRVFQEFESSLYGELLGTDFITKRLQEQLPPSARSLLAWASLLGNTFSFACVQRLLGGEFDFPSEQDEQSSNCVAGTKLFPHSSEINAVEGLQACLQAYILVPGENDDEFRFSHDRYIRAAESLRECHNVEKMHFIIAQTLMKYSGLEERSLYARANHVCQSIKMIKSRVLHRSRFRHLLLQAGKRAVESGARSTGLSYIENCLHLMQADPWTESAKDSPDVYYEETLDVHTRAAELYWYQGQQSEAAALISSVFNHARDAIDKSPCWILQGRLHAQRGDLPAAFNALKTSLDELGLEWQRVTTWNSCDEEFKKLHEHMEGLDMEELVQRPPSTSANVVAMGSIMMEAMSAAYWSDALLFYQMVIQMTGLYLREGAFVQAGLGLIEFAVVAMSRFGFETLRYHTLGIRIFRRFNDPYTLGRGLTISLLFTAHLHIPMQEHLGIFEEAIDYTVAVGDKSMFLIATGGLSITKLYLGQDMADLESFCTFAPEECENWPSDGRGGLIIVAVRQVARALQGKTANTIASEVMSDNDHNSENYIRTILAQGPNGQRARDIYNSLKMIPLFLYGHHDETVELGNSLLDTLDDLWSIRNVPLILFFLSLSMMASHRGKERPSVPETEQLLAKVKDHKTRIELWEAESNPNHSMWVSLIEGEIHELEGNYQKAVHAFESAIDHTQAYNFALEEALSLELQGEFFVRRGAKRGARAVLEESLSAYNRLGATGKVNQLMAKYTTILNTVNKSFTADVSVQTAKSIGDLGNTQERIEENERQETQTLGKETAGDRTIAWLSPSGKPTEDSDYSHLGLDVLDLQSLLEFNHAISSELQIDRLLGKMTEIILECAGAEFASVVIEQGADQGGMSMAASGTQDGITTDPMPLIDVTSETVKQIVFYTLRFKETVFVQNILQDERFSPNAVSARAVISLPIFHSNQLLGVLYLEGQANSFTARNLSVLRLFCNQVGISIANALLFRRIRKVSAANMSMIESQKRALAKALEAENKAKVAEAEAIRNVRLKEEAAKAKSMFLANVSHELRTPLNGVIGMSELLKGTPLNTEQDGYADSIRVCADTLLTVINDILDFSKLEAGKMKLFSVPLNLRETITEVIRALSFTNFERGLHTVEDLDMDENLLILGDPVRLHQIFMNLLSNAYKFTKPGGTITVRSRTEHEDDHGVRITCCVEDTGIGITQEQTSRLFQPFSQADSSSQRNYGGSGLGLSICKALVGALHGKIWLESQIGVGTKVFFTIFFPKAQKDSETGVTPFSPRDVDPMATWSSETDLSGLHDPSIIDLSKIPRDQIRICIAEDNPINQKIAVSFVKKLGFMSTAYSDGKAAVEGLRQKSREGNPFHLVLMDVQMPVLDGYDATRLIRIDEDAAVRSVLIIAMTASAIRGDREKCLDAGMNNYLAKPVRAAVLKSMLEEYLSQPPKPFPNLQEVASELARDAIDIANFKDGETLDMPESKSMSPSKGVSGTPGHRPPRISDSPGSAFSRGRQKSAIRAAPCVRPTIPNGQAKSSLGKLSTEMRLINQEANSIDGVDAPSDTNPGGSID